MKEFKTWYEFHRGKVLLYLVYAILFAVVFFRVSVHPLAYTTPDSIAYLEQSEYIANQWDGGSFLNLKGEFTLWPIGYPLMISVVSALTGLTPLLASKAVNLLFIGLLFVLLYRWFGEKAWFVSLPVFSYGALEVISETWSESPFVFFVFLLAYFLTRKKEMPGYKFVLGLTLTLTCLFLFRYVGLIYFFLVLMLAMRLFYLKKNNQALNLFMPFMISLIFVLWYFLDNYWASGYVTGESRFEPGHTGFWDFLKNFLVGWVNEGFIIRKYYFKGSFDLLFVVLLLIQMGVMYFVYRKWKEFKKYVRPDRGFQVLLLVGISCLAGMFVLNIFTSFDTWDFRILFPFSFPILAGLFSSLTEHASLYQKSWKLIVLFMGLSLLVNLPKTYLIQWFGDLFTETF